MSWRKTAMISTIGAVLGTIIIFTFFNPLENNPKKPMNEQGTQKEKTIREPAVAGAFYPGNERELSEIIGEFLSKAEKPNIEGRVAGLLVPHAGYPFSGKTAATGYKAVQGEKYNTVIIIGTSHSARFKGASVFREGAYETPFGNIEIDEEMAKTLLESEHINHIPEAHRDEHSIEVQLPFLSKVLKSNYKITPVIIGGGEGKNIVEPIVEKITDSIKKNPEKKILLVASSDLSHYPSYDDASEADKKVLEAISSGDIEEIRSTIERLENQKIENAATFACAQRAIEIVLETSKELGADEFKVLDYSNAGDATGDRSRVVGYGAMAFIDTKNEEGKQSAGDVRFETAELNPEQKQKLLDIAKETVERHVRGEVLQIPNVDDQDLEKHQGVFVTLKKNTQLRGCIGIFEANQPLWNIVQQVAISAATQDDRFQPVSKDELNEIEYEISVLSPLKKIDNPNLIQLGKHGVKIEKEGRSGVFLPKVAEETGWSFERFMNEICTQKMGLDEGCWKEPDAEIYVFETTEFSEKTSNSR